MTPDDDNDGVEVWRCGRCFDLTGESLWLLSTNQPCAYCHEPGTRRHDPFIAFTTLRAEQLLAGERENAKLRETLDTIGKFASSFTDESNDWLRVIQACEHALHRAWINRPDTDHCGYLKPHAPHRWDGDGYPESDTHCPGTSGSPDGGTR